MLMNFKKINESNINLDIGDTGVDDRSWIEVTNARLIRRRGTQGFVALRPSGLFGYTTSGRPGEVHVWRSAVACMVYLGVD